MLGCTVRLRGVLAGPGHVLGFDWNKTGIQYRNKGYFATGKTVRDGMGDCGGDAGYSDNNIITE